MSLWSWRRCRRRMVMDCFRLMGPRSLTRRWWAGSSVTVEFRARRGIGFDFGIRNSDAFDADDSVSLSAFSDVGLLARLLSADDWQDETRDGRFELSDVVSDPALLLVVIASSAMARSAAIFTSLVFRHSAWSRCSFFTSRRRRAPDIALVDRFRFSAGYINPFGGQR